MKTLIRMTILLLMIAATTRAKAQEKEDDDSLETVTLKPSENLFVLDAQLFTRGEIRDGGLPANKTENPETKANFVVERARLVFGYKHDFLEAKINVQHEGLWGMEGDGGNFDIYEAWAHLKAKNGLFARIGRQELIYDDERILGSDDWSMAAMSHDGLKVGYEGHGHYAHAFFAYNQNAKNQNGGTFYKDGAQVYKTMQVLWYHYDVPKFPLGISLIAMNTGMQGGNEDDYHTVNQQTVGGYLTFKPKKLTLEASYYRQMGKASLNYESGTELPIRAWMASVKATYDFSKYFTGYVGYDYLSGEKGFVVPQEGQIGQVKHTEITGFTSIFGSRHKFYGAMDFFYVSAYFDTYSPGLQTLYAGGTVHPIDNLSLKAAYHYMGVTTDASSLKKTLGHEIAFSASYDFHKDMTIGCGYSFMRGTDTMVRLKRSTDRRQLHWAWVMLKISPRIFSAKW